PILFRSPATNTRDKAAIIINSLLGFINVRLLVTGIAKYLAKNASMNTKARFIQSMVIILSSHLITK
ncbi:hypothetical protein, partial [Bacillus toyonensis]|uniref:hypothetical protein n=1 Tax=Bacillus toyonensis TaxID=155322 RepID=UPI003F68B24F